jgi:RimJ/RimL family protein N-acetyltransferase
LGAIAGEAPIGGNRFQWRTFTDERVTLMGERMAEISTKRLLLRPASADDLAALHDIFSNDAAMAFWSTPPHKEMAETEASVASMMSIDPQQGEDFVVEQNGRVIGKAGLYQFPEIGFILHPESWGNGYAQEALFAVVERAFSVHRLPSVDADVDPRNEASLRLLQRLGFEVVGHAPRTWNVGGVWCDSVYLRLLSPRTDGR